MIKFFRHIRKTLISENKMGKYFKYAIGEILLVVIGILIALQINNWNEGRKRLDQERVLLQQVKDEMISQYGGIAFDLEKLNTSQRAHFLIIDHMEANLPYRDSLCFYFSLLKMDEYNYPSEAVYSKIKNVGLDIIRVDSIRNNLQDLYEQTYPRLTKEKAFNQDIEEFLNDYYLDNFRVNTDLDLEFSFTHPKDSIGDKVYEEYTIQFPNEFELDGKNRLFTIGYVPLDYEALRVDPKFKMLLNQADNYRDYKIGRYDMARAQIKMLVNAIDLTLAK
jgi:hypothetical protein